ncbi:MAG: hypothetical protein ACOH15_07545 [Acetobacterium sp.]
MYLTEFENKILKSYGCEFQELFHKLMRQNNCDFMPIVPDGSHGDGGCDGYLKKEGTYYQIYGPKSSNDSVKRNSNNKFEVDFKKLCDYLNSNKMEFPKLKKYIFVFNNKYESHITMSLSSKINIMQKKYPNVIFEVFDNNQIKKIFTSLDSNSQRIILDKAKISDRKNTNVVLEEIEIQDNECDLKNLNKIIIGDAALINGIMNEDFVCPFQVNIFSKFDSSLEICSAMFFMDHDLEHVKEIYKDNNNELLGYICKYAKNTVNPDIAVLKRIGPGQEVEGSYSDFEVVTNKIYEYRKKAINSYNDLKKYKIKLIDRINRIKDLQT